MTKEEVRALLSQPITSKEQFDAVLKKIHPHNAGVIGQSYPVLGNYYGIDDQMSFGHGRPLGLNGSSVFNFHHTRWWLVREWLRLAAGVYETTAPLRCITNRFPELAAHCAVKTDDPTMIAYTPDPQSGERDKQLSTSFGKLVRRLYPHLSDDAIRDAEAAHRAEAMNELELLTGDAIAAAYQTGVGSCMSHTPVHWGLEQHPAEVYDAPGIALAVTRDGNKRVNSRCIVYVNPKDENDKRFVRVYGDTALVSRLRRAGYRNAGLEGAQLKRIQVGKSGSALRLVMPYLDRPQSPDGCVEDKFAVGIILDEDPKYVRVVGRTLMAQLHDVTGVPVPSAQVTAGSILVPTELTVAALNATCPITGEKIDIADPGSYRRAWVDGRVQVVAKSAVGDFPIATVRKDDGRWEPGIYVPNGTPTFVCGGTNYVDTTATRAALGFVQLAATRYGPNRWATGDECVRLPDDSRCLKADVTQVVAMRAGYNRPQITLVWSADVTDRKRYRVVQRAGAMRTVVDLQSDPKVQVVQTTTGRHVVPGIHPVVQTSDERWIFARNAENVRSFGHRWVIAKGEVLSNVVPIERRIARVVAELHEWAQCEFADNGCGEAALDAIVRSFVLQRMPRGYLVWRSGDRWKASTYHDTTYQTALQAAEAMRDGTLTEGTALTNYAVLDHETFAAQQAFMFALRDELTTARAQIAQDERFVVAA